MHLQSPGQGTQSSCIWKDLGGGFDWELTITLELGIDIIRIRKVSNWVLISSGLKKSPANHFYFQ